LPDASFETQAKQVIGKRVAILEAAGAASGQLARVIAYIVSIEHWQRFDAIFAEMLGAARPAGTRCAGARTASRFPRRNRCYGLVGRPA